MKRKLIKQGGGGYTIYLPKKWVDGRGLKAGYEIELTEQGAGLFLGKGAGTEELRGVQADITRLDKDSIFKQLVAMYESGFDEIRFTFQKDEALDIKTGKKVRTLEGHESGVTRAFFDKTGGKLASGDLSGAVRIWNMATGKSRKTSTNHEKFVSCLEFDDTGKLLASIVMIMGYGIIAVPTGIVTVELAQARRIPITTEACPDCGAGGHDNDADFCKFCGARL